MTMTQASSAVETPLLARLKRRVQPGLIHGSPKSANVLLAARADCCGEHVEQFHQSAMAVVLLPKHVQE
jgi:hypothetical protein